MKLRFFLSVILTLSLTGQVLSQDDIDEDDVAAPFNVFALVSNTVPLFALVGWTGNDEASYYNVQIYRTSDDVLFQEIQNVFSTSTNVAGLEPGTNYTAYVSAVYTTEDGNEIESAPSDPHFFATRTPCTGRQVHLPCTAHCVSTCEDPDPICSRQCVPGCGCPTNLPIWFQGGCIPRVLCPPPTGSPILPRNVQVERFESGEIVVVWEEVENAVGYTVQVRRTDLGNAVVQTIESDGPFTVVDGLEANEVYLFSVAANLSPQDDSDLIARDAILPPSNIFISNITDHSFRVQWTPRSEAVRYVFVLFDESQTAPLYTNERVPGNIINVESLAPGTTYYFSLASVRRETDPGIFSPLMRVRTEGTSPEGLLHAATIMVGVPEETTTPVTTTTTPPPTTMPQTICLQEYDAVRQFVETFPDLDPENIPRFPDCDSDGLYVTRRCDRTNSNECFCVSAETGEKLRGSDFGGSNSAFELDCDQYGALDVTISPFNVRSIRSVLMLLEWDSSDVVDGYVVTVSSENLEDRTQFVSQKSLLLEDLIPGQTYTIGVYAINSQGWSSSISYINATTAFVDAPENLRVTETTGNSATITWESSFVGVDSFEVHVVLTETNEVVETYFDVLLNFITIFNLRPSISYRIEVRSVAIIGFDDVTNEPITHRSEEASVDVTLQCQLPPLDLLYVLDSSANVGWLHLQDVKGLMQNITQDVAPVNQDNGTRVSVVKYYRIARSSFSFSRFSSTRTVSLALSFLSYNGGSNHNVTRALEYIRENYFSSSTNADNQPRPDAMSIVVFFSIGGPQSDFNLTRAAANSLGQVANVVSVGVEGESDDTVLDAIASRPNLKVVAPSYDELRNVDTTIIDKFCTLL